MFPSTLSFGEINTPGSNIAVKAQQESYTAPREAIKALYRAYEDAKNNRLTQANRLRMIALHQAGINPRDKAEVNKQGPIYLNKLMEDFKYLLKISEDDLSIFDIRKSKFDKLMKEEMENLPHGLLLNYTTAMLCSNYLNLERLEAKAVKNVEKALESVPLWNLYLKSMPGMGPVTAGAIISNVDIHQTKYVSNLWALAGYDVAPDGKGRSRKKEHLVEREYIDADGKTKTRQSITFNPELKTSLYTWAAAQIRLGGKYRTIYDNYKHRLEHRPDVGLAMDGKTNDKGYKVSKGLRDNRARRYMIKMMLKDLYIFWRDLEGLPVYDGYEEAKLGIKHTA